MLGQEGTAAIVSYYGRDPVGMRLAPEFHWRRLKLISSHASVLSWDSPRWNAARRNEEVFHAMRYLGGRGTHLCTASRSRTPPAAYTLLDTAGRRRRSAPSSTTRCEEGTDARGTAAWRRRRPARGDRRASATRSVRGRGGTAVVRALRHGRSRVLRPRRQRAGPTASAHRHPQTRHARPRVLGRRDRRGGAACSACRVGDKVVVFPLVTCGTCWACVQGEPILCATKAWVGMSTPAGGLADRAVLDESDGRVRSATSTRCSAP